MLKPLCRCFIMHVAVWLSDTVELYGRHFYRGSWKTEEVLQVSAADASGAFHRHPPSLWRMSLEWTLTADAVLYTNCKFDVYEWNCIESPRLTLCCSRIAQISPLKSHLISFILPTSNRKPFLSILKLPFISFQKVFSWWATCLQACKAANVTLMPCLTATESHQQ